MLNALMGKKWKEKSSLSTASAQKKIGSVIWVFIEKMMAMALVLLTLYLMLITLHRRNVMTSTMFRRGTEREQVINAKVELNITILNYLAQDSNFFEFEV